MSVDVEAMAKEFQDYTNNMIALGFQQSCVGVRNDVLIQGVNNETRKPDKIQSTN